MWGEVYDNRTANGMLGDVLDRSVDLTIGAFCRWQLIFEFMTYSNAIQQANTIMLVPRPRLASYYEVRCPHTHITVYIVASSFSDYSSTISFFNLGMPTRKLHHECNCVVHF